MERACAGPLSRDCSDITQQRAEVSGRSFALFFTQHAWRAAAEEDHPAHCAHSVPTLAATTTKATRSARTLFISRITIIVQPIRRLCHKYRFSAGLSPDRPYSVAH